MKKQEEINILLFGSLPLLAISADGLMQNRPPIVKDISAIGMKRRAWLYRGDSLLAAHTA